MKQDEIESLRQQLAAKQAEVDALMLEYCPSEMSQEQLDTWAAHQRPSEWKTNDELRQQLAERDKQIIMLRDGLAMAVSIIGHPDDDGTKHLQKILADTAACVRVERRVIPWRHDDELRTLRKVGNARVDYLQTMLADI